MIPDQMYKLKIATDPKVTDKFKAYPKPIQAKLDYLRSLMVETASECDAIAALEETLKWGEPNFLVKKGSTNRKDWKPKAPNQYAMYFKRTSKLGPPIVRFMEILLTTKTPEPFYLTFKMIYQRLN